MSDDFASLVWYSDRGHKHYPVNQKPPQDQCKDRDQHVPHTYDDPKGLIWSCQGRGNQ